MLKVCSFIPCDGFGKALGVAIERVPVISSNVDKTDCKMIFIFKHLNVKKLRNYTGDTHFNRDALAYHFAVPSCCFFWEDFGL